MNDETTTRPDPAGYDEAIEGMAAFVEEAAVLRGVAEGRDGFLDVLEALRLQKRNLEGALLIVILGGTGVGKSTLINALAGEGVAETSAVRPCTMRTTFYTHRENDLSPLSAVVRDDDKVVAHEAIGLQRKILVDPPDFDSMMLENRRRLLEVLRVADMVLVTVDAEKYRNRSLCQLLRRFRAGRSFLFVVNKADHGVNPAVVDDFRQSLSEEGVADPRIFLISALAAFEARTGAGSHRDEGAFAELESVLLEEIDRAAIDRIKSSNLTALLSNTYASIKTVLPGGLEAGLEGLSDRAEADAAELARRVGAEMASALFEEEDRIRNFLLTADSLSIGGVFGLYLAVSEKLSGLVKPRLGSARAQDPVELKAAVRRALAKVDHERLGLLSNRFRSDLLTHMENLGLRAAEAEPHALPGDGRAIVRELTEDAATLVRNRIGAFIERSTSGYIRSVLLNILPLAYIVYFGWVGVVRIGKGKMLDLPFFLTFVGLLVVVCFLQQLLVERAFRRRGGRFITDLEREIAEKALKAFDARLVPSVRTYAQALAARVKAFRALGKLISGP